LRCVHHIRLGILQVHSVALAVVELMRKHGGPALKAVSSTNKSGLQVVQLIIKEMDRIAAFCAFGQFLDSKKAVGNIRLTGSAKWSGDMIAVGPPLMLTVTESRTPGLCSSELAFATVHINGKTGKPTYPHMASGMLKRPATRETPGGEYSVAADRRASTTANARSVLNLRPRQRNLCVVTPHP